MHLYLGSQASHPIGLENPFQNRSNQESSWSCKGGQNKGVFKSLGPRPGRLPQSINITHSKCIFLSKGTRWIQTWKKRKALLKLDYYLATLPIGLVLVYHLNFKECLNSFTRLKSRYIVLWYICSMKSKYWCFWILMLEPSSLTYGPAYGRARLNS